MRYSSFRRMVPAAILALGVITVGAPAQATEGYFQHGNGVVSKALAGAGVAFSQDAMGQTLNPAGLVDVENQLNLGVSAFSPMRSFTGSGSQPAPFPVPNGEFDSDNELFPIPNFGVSYRLDADSNIGFSLHGNGGMNTEWEGMAHPFGGDGVFRGGRMGVDLSQTFLQATYARTLFDGFSVGVAPIFAIQAFEAKGLSSFAGFSDDDSNLTNNDHDISYGFGGRLGLQYAILDNLKIGAAYQTRTYMTEFDKYAGLFAEQGDFDIPPALQVGISWKPIDDVTLMFDYRRIWYSDIASVGNPGPTSYADMLARGLGGNDGVGFGWEDVNIFKFGAQWEVDEDWTLRAGYSNGENPIGSSEVLFNIMAPGVIEHHITGGLTYKIDENNSINIGGFYAPSASVSGPNPLSTGQTVELEMSQYEFSVGWAWKF
jgi:long-chain fatty acid transport protein